MEDCVEVIVAPLSIEDGGGGGGEEGRFPGTCYLPSFSREWMAIKSFTSIKSARLPLHDARGRLARML